MRAPGGGASFWRWARRGVFVWFLNLSRAAIRVRGWLRGPDGTRERFEGLLGLLAALDAARSSERGGTDGETSPLGTAEHPEG